MTKLIRDLITAAILMTAVPTFAYSFAELFYVRTQAEKLGFITKPQTYIANQTFLYSVYFVGNQHTSVLIKDTTPTSVHYLEKEMRNEVIYYEGWLDRETGQLTRLKKNGVDQKIEPRDEPISLVPGDVEKTCPVGTFKTVHLKYTSNPGTAIALAQDLYISSDAPGVGVISGVGQGIATTTYIKWIEFKAKAKADKSDFPEGTKYPAPTT